MSLLSFKLKRVKKGYEAKLLDVSARSYKFFFVFFCGCFEIQLERLDKLRHSDSDPEKLKSVVSKLLPDAVLIRVNGSSFLFIDGLKL